MPFVIMSSDCGQCDKCAITNIDTSNLAHKNWRLKENERVVVPVTIDNLGFLFTTTYVVSYIIVPKGQTPTNHTHISVGQGVMTVGAISITETTLDLNVFGAKFTNAASEQVDLFISCYPVGMDSNPDKGEYKFVNTLTVDGTNGYVKIKSLSVPKEVVKDVAFMISVTVEPTAPVDDVRLVIHLDDYQTITDSGIPLVRSYPKFRITDASSNASRDMTPNGGDYVVQIGRITGPVTKQYRCIIPTEIMSNSNIDKEGYFRFVFKVGTYITGDKQLFEHDASDVQSIRFTERDEKLVRLKINSVPTGAMVTIQTKTGSDRRTVKAPVETDVPPGDYIITASLPGYTMEPLSVVVTEADTVKTIPIALTKEEEEEDGESTDECRYVDGRMTVWRRKSDGTYEDTKESCSGIPSCVQVPGLESMGCVSTPLVAVGVVAVALLLKNFME